MRIPLASLLLVACGTDGVRRSDPATVDKSRGQLLELLDDYELLGLGAR